MATQRTARISVFWTIELFLSYGNSDVLTRFRTFNKIIELVLWFYLMKLQRDSGQWAFELQFKAIGASLKRKFLFEASDFLPLFGNDRPFKRALFRLPLPNWGAIKIWTVFSEHTFDFFCDKLVTQIPTAKQNQLRPQKALWSSIRFKNIPTTLKFKVTILNLAKLKAIENTRYRSYAHLVMSLRIASSDQPHISSPTVWTRRSSKLFNSTIGPFLIWSKTTSN